MGFSDDVQAEGGTGLRTVSQGRAWLWSKASQSSGPLGILPEGAGGCSYGRAACVTWVTVGQGSAGQKMPKERQPEGSSPELKTLWPGRLF